MAITTAPAPALALAEAEAAASTMAPPRPAAPTRRPSARTRPPLAAPNETDRAAAAAAATPASGLLQLAISPWGQVDVDGKPAGTTPPLSRLNLAVGSHTVTVRNADFPAHTITVQVQADKPVTVRHRFGL